MTYCIGSDHQNDADDPMHTTNPPSWLTTIERQWGAFWPYVSLRGAIALLLLWQDRAVERHCLAGLDDRGLKDIGLSRADVAAECRKPFWRS